MKLKLSKPVQCLIFVLLMAVVVGFMDWEHFFPLAAHNDLQFQLIGESFECLVVFGVIGVLFVLFSESGSGPATENGERRKLIGGAAFFIVTLAMSWRSFFPANHYRFNAGLDALGSSAFMGIFFGIFAMASPRKLVKPSKEEEKSVV